MKKNKIKPYKKKKETTEETEKRISREIKNKKISYTLKNFWNKQRNLPASEYIQYYSEMMKERRKRPLSEKQEFYRKRTFDIRIEKNRRKQYLFLAKIPYNRLTRYEIRRIKELIAWGYDKEPWEV